MVDELFDYLKQFNKGVKQGVHYNQFQSRPTYYKFSVENDFEDERTFNEILFKIRDSNLNHIIRTRSGAIAKGPRYMSNNYAWDIKQSKISIRLTVIMKGYLFVFNMGSKKQEEISISPSQAFKTFVNECFNDNIDLYSYAIEKGSEEKKLIPSPLVSMTHIDETLENVHHIDFHNSYPAGLANTHPEFRPTIERLYNKRKEDDKYKLVLNCSMGCMQSTKFPWNARFSHLAKDAIEDNNRRVSHLAFQLEITGREIIGFNVDGIWYRGNIYHGEGEGDKLGEWHNDHTNCKFRAKSAGVYEFIENGKYHPVVRGSSTLDIIEPDRSNWHWGDIYRQSSLIFKFSIEEGVTHYEI